MNEPRALPPRPRDRLFATVTLVLAVLLLPVALARHPGRARELACRWALRMRFPAEDLTGLTDGAMAAFTAARTEALWRHGQLIGLTSGYRDPLVQQRLFDEEVRRSGSPASARMLVLPPAESSHVKGIALDVRPLEGARWLEEHGARYDLYRTYDNEWWHFEHRPDSGGTPPRRRPHPGATLGRRAKPCLWSGPFLHRAPGITGTLNDVPGLAAHRDRRRPDDGRSSVSGLALDGASSQIGSTVASGAATLCTTTPGDSLARTFGRKLRFASRAELTQERRRPARPGDAPGRLDSPGRLGLGRRSATGYRDS
jgi:hypothetical protein